MTGVVDQARRGAAPGLRVGRRPDPVGRRRGLVGYRAGPGPRTAGRPQEAGMSAEPVAAAHPYRRRNHHLGVLSPGSGRPFRWDPGQLFPSDPGQLFQSRLIPPGCWVRPTWAAGSGPPGCRATPVVDLRVAPSSPAAESLAPVGPLSWSAPRLEHRRRPHARTWVARRGRIRRAVVTPGLRGRGRCRRHRTRIAGKYRRPAS